MVEHGSEKPGVDSSILSLGTPDVACRMSPTDEEHPSRPRPTDGLPVAQPPYGLALASDAAMDSSIRGLGRTDVGFVGRRNELDSLLAEAAQVRAGHPRVALLTGEPGIGKTALAHRFVSQTQGFHLWEASGEEAEQLLTFGVIGQLLRAAPESEAPALSGLGGGTSESRDPIWVGAALVELLGAMQASGPVLLLIDDAQWADRSSLQALIFALRRLQADRVLTVVISRSGSPRGHLAGFHRLVEHGHGAWVRVRGLDAASIRDLGASMGVDHLSSRAADRIRAHTGGSPLHTTAIFDEIVPEILREPSDLPLPSPADFAALVRARLEACPPDAQRLVGAASVLGLTCRLAQAGRLADLVDTLAPLERAMAAHLLEERGGPADRAIAFPHPLVQAATYHTLGPAHRAELHERAAGLVTDEAAALRHRVAAARGADPQLAADLIIFGIQIARRGAWDAAADALLSATRLTADGPERDQRLLMAAEFMLLGGAVDDALALVDEIHLQARTARRGFVLGSLAMIAGRYEKAQDLLTVAYDDCDSIRDHPLAEEIAAQLAHVHMGRGHGADAALWATRSLDAYRAPSPVSDSLSVLAIGLLFAGRAPEAAASVAELTNAHEVGETASLDGFIGRGYVRCVTDDPLGLGPTSPPSLPSSACADQRTTPSRRSPRCRPPNTVWAPGTIRRSTGSSPPRLPRTPTRRGCWPAHMRPRVRRSRGAAIGRPPMPTPRQHCGPRGWCEQSSRVWPRRRWPALWSRVLGAITTV